MRDRFPEWMKIATDQRFIEMTTQAEKQNEVIQLGIRLREIDKMLKNELSQSQYKLILEWEEILNYRSALEKKWLYSAGIKDGKELL
ncbi:hypothetical protein MHB77_23875 [Paenibacillus sp. FSL K6-3166]|uniref:hypothetical protein n=1 Tax=unclassified Paenibacillus TaxID=185978 RepID=UPI000BA0E60F|nr:hypothetical protein [Paenibacillus sp. VTT E-133291]OZQ78301.1 hypothetical protein CA598_29290 [Paenibacillus sp. VTT E-133291]